MGLMTKKGLEYKSDIEKNERIFFVLLPMIPCFTTFMRELDNDLWFLLSHGRYVMNYGIPHIEPLTIHEGLDFVMQQWLSSVLLFLTYDNFGEFGIKILTFICYVIGAYIVYKLCLLVSNKYFLSSIITFFYSILIINFMVARPYIFSNIVFLLEIYYLEKYAQRNSKKLIYILPILSTILINIQASMWPMLFVITIPYAIDSLNFKIGTLKSNGYGIYKILYVNILMFFLGFVNPYGIEAMKYLSNSYGIEVINLIVSEMYPATVKTLFGIVIILTVIPVSAYYLISNSKYKSIRYMLLALGTGYLSLSAYRGYIFFASCAVFPISSYLRDSYIPVYNIENKKFISLLRKALFFLILITSIATIYLFHNRIYKSYSDYDLLKEMVLIVSDDSLNSTVKLYTGYNDGCLAEFYGIRTYLDTRAEVFIKKNNKSADILNEYYELQAGKLYYKTFLEKYKFTHLITNSHDILNEYMYYDSDFYLLASNEKYKLFKLKMNFD